MSNLGNLTYRELDQKIYSLLNVNKSLREEIKIKESEIKMKDLEIRKLLGRLDMPDQTEFLEEDSWLERYNKNEAKNRYHEMEFKA